MLADLIRPALQLLPTGRHRMLRIVGAGEREDHSWDQLSSRYRVFYDRDIKAYVWADLADWGGRWHYYCGRYYDPTNQKLLRQILSPGDTYIDVGANYGIHALLATKCVGEEGRVYCFEPNPPTFDVLKVHKVINHRENMLLFHMGLSDAEGELTLSGADHAGTFTFRAVGDATHATQVQVRVGDEVLHDCPARGKILVKIDTEGFEHHVLKGLKEFRKRPNVAFVVEITDAWLRETGSSAAELFEDMRADGYHAYHPRMKSPRLKYGLALDRVDHAVTEQHDLLFARPGFAALPS
jgi:FkbM family methyltransferase